MDLIEEILLEWTWRIDKPHEPDINNLKHLYRLIEALQYLKFPNDFIVEFISNLSENNSVEQILDQEIEDPDSNKKIKVRDALQKDQDSEVYKNAAEKLSNSDNKGKDIPFPKDVDPKDVIKKDGLSYRTDMMTDDEIEKLEKNKKDDDLEK